MALGTGSSLRDEETFPPYPELPGDHNLISASRHWCFLGEIITYNFFSRLVLHVHDRAGRSLLIAFYTDDAGTLMGDSCKAGHTIAVLYAQQHNFLDGSVGVRIEDIKHVRVCCI